MIYSIDTCICEVFSGENTESLRIPGVEASFSVSQGDVCIGIAGPCSCDATNCMVRVLIWFDFASY